MTVSHLRAEADRLQRQQDALLEDEIERVYQAMLDAQKAGRRTQAAYYADSLKRLVAKRSPGQVAMMERSRGLKP